MVEIGLEKFLQEHFFQLICGLLEDGLGGQKYRVFHVACL